MTHNDPNPNDFNVKEILTRFVLPKQDELADKLEEYKRDVDRRIGKIEASRNKMVGALTLIGVALIPLSVPVISAVLHA